MIDERNLVHSLYTPDFIYFRMVTVLHMPILQVRSFGLGALSKEASGESIEGLYEAYEGVA